MSLLGGGIHGSTLSGMGGEKCKMDTGHRATDRILDILSWRGRWAERLAHRDEEAGRGGRDTGMRGRNVRIVQTGGIDVRRG